MSQAQLPSRKRPYGLQRVCRVWQFPRSTVHEHRRRAALRPEEREHHEHRPLGQREQVLEELERGRIGPVQVLQHDDRRPVGCEALE